MTVSIWPKCVIECAIQFSAKNVNSNPRSHPSHNARRVVTPPPITFNKGASATQARKLSSNGGNERMSRRAEATAANDCHSNPSGASENRESDKLDLIRAIVAPHLESDWRVDRKARPRAVVDPDRSLRSRTHSPGQSGPCCYLSYASYSSRFRRRRVSRADRL